MPHDKGKLLAKRELSNGAILRLHEYEVAILEGEEGNETGAMLQLTVPFDTLSEYYQNMVLHTVWKAYIVALKYNEDRKAAENSDGFERGLLQAANKFVNDIAEAYRD